MGVDETRSDQRVRVFDNLGAGRQGWQQFGGVADARDLAVLDDQQAVLEVFMGLLDAHFARVGEAVEQGGTVGFGAWHGDSRNRCMRVMR